jgi:branched-chain amino acid aminotransferase
MNGEFVPFEEAKVHVLTHALHYGTGVFEGIRAYETANGTGIFRHREHLERLYRSAELFYMPIPFTLKEVAEATKELISRSGLRSCYIRPIVFRGHGPMGLYPLDSPVDVVVGIWEWAAYLGEEGKRFGIRAKISSWRRLSPESLIPAAKASGQYLNSVLAKVESTKAGYDEAILLDHQGNVCEGTGENIFIIRDGKLITPGYESSILGGINRASIIEIATDLGYEIEERSIARAELQVADEAFLSGTAAELVPIREVDDHPLSGGKPGPITLEIQSKFEDALHGRDDRYRHWLDLVPVSSPSSAKAA